MRSGSRGAARVIAGAMGLAALVLGGGCAAPMFGSVTAYSYFAEPAEDDAWSGKIRGWQDRQRGSTPAVAESGRGAPAEIPAAALRAKYDAFRAEQRRELARDLARWIQAEAPDHYVADGAVDHWATLEETFDKGGEDCDGLELLVFNLLRDLGFGDDEVFRSIVMRSSDGQHHMVTLWFENPNDPWVIDPTGAMTTGMPRMSDVPGWVPLKIFSEHRDFTVEPALRTARR